MSEQHRALAVTLRAAQWLLDDVASDLPTERVTPEQFAELADALDDLRRVVREFANP